MTNVLATELTLQAEESHQVDWGTVGSTVFTGLAVVFLILIILVVILWGMGKIMSLLTGENKKRKVNKVKDTVEIPEPSVFPGLVTTDDQTEDENDEEIIAVISAAIAAYGAADGKNYRIAHIKKKRVDAGASKWAMAGISENTRQF